MCDVPPVGQAETVLTADQGMRGGKVLQLKQTVDKAVEGLAFVRHVFVMKRTGGNVPHTPKDVSLEEVSWVECAHSTRPSTNDSLFLLGLTCVECVQFPSPPPTCL